ncbi:MAG TPA: thioredoxin family protein [Candidatus Angelobacter sp.]|nr:thioredoxin family protein [Candidatus Angelobacter sp.]
MKIFIILLLSLAPFGVRASAQATTQGYQPVMRFDPKRNGAQDISDAVEEAKRTNRRVLMEIGGDWASWCHTMDEFFQSHSDLRDFRDKHYVTVFVNYSVENQNRQLLSKYPAIFEYPHFFVLDKDGKVLASQGTSVLEQGETYNPVKMRAFLQQWSNSDDNHPSSAKNKASLK